MHASNSSPEKTETKGPGAHYPPSLAYMVSAGPVRDSVSEKRGGWPTRWLSQLKALATRPDDQNSVPGAAWRKEGKSSCEMSPDHHRRAIAQMCAHTYA